jgi:MOSC domain-containing protein YiiM
MVAAQHIQETSMARVLQIFICPEKGKPMVSVQHVRAMKGLGLEGDRYATNKGTYSGLPLRSNKASKVRHVTLFTRYDLQEANGQSGTSFEPHQTRRNIYVGEMSDIRTLIGKEFYVGTVRMRGVEECTPCNLPGSMLDNKSSKEPSKGPIFNKAFTNRGGIRAEVLSDGEIHIGDELRLAA